MSICKEGHRRDERFLDLPADQGGSGRHKCAGCAYSRGVEDGLARAEKVDLRFSRYPAR